MRITIHVDAFNTLNPRASAIIWCDREARRWSREAHMGIELPEWGTLREDGDDLLLEDEAQTRTLFVLEGLDIESNPCLHTGTHGKALYCPGISELGVAGHWSLQCVDPEAVHPEHSVFADLKPE